MGFDYRKKDIIWTASDYNIGSEIVNELPYIELQGYQQTFASIVQAANNWARIVKTDTYPGIYMGSIVASSHFYLPFFTEGHHQIGQNWQESQGPAIVQNGLDIVENVGKMLLPAAGIIYPKSYAGASEYAYEINFDLINTIPGGTGGFGGYENNQKFIDQFIKENLHLQIGSLAVWPPLIYEAFVPGIRWSPACVVSNLTITNKGTLNKIDGRIIPDAWGVQIQLRELLNESRQLYDAATKPGATGSSMGPDVKVIIQDSQILGKEGENVITNVTNAVKNNTNTGKTALQSTAASLGRIFRIG